MVNLLADMGIEPGTLQSGLVATTASTDSTAPTSTINPIASFSAQTTITISGTASDLGGGVIGAVEVSTDGGINWYNAIGDENWTYTWSPQVAGTYTIKSQRSSIPSIWKRRQQAARWSSPLHLTLHSSRVGKSRYRNSTDASAVTLGVRFQSSVAGTVSGIRYYKGSQDTGTHTGQLWSSTGTLLANATFTNETASGWQT